MAASVTRKGREVASGRFVGTTPSQAAPLYVTWGYNPQSLAAANSDVAMFQEGAEARTLGTGTQQNSTGGSVNTGGLFNDVFQVVGSITATGTRTVAEVGLFDASTQPTQNTVAAGGVVGSNSSTTLNTSTNFTPGNNNYVQIRTEVMQVTAGSGTSALTVVRACNGSTAISTIAATDPVTPGNPPGQTGITGGNMYGHAEHANNGLNNGDSITYTLKVTFS